MFTTATVTQQFTNGQTTPIRVTLDFPSAILDGTEVLRLDFRKSTKYRGAVLCALVYDPANGGAVPSANGSTLERVSWTTQQLVLDITLSDEETDAFPYVGTVSGDLEIHFASGQVGTPIRLDLTALGGSYTHE